MSTTTVGFIGLGIMGGPMAGHLLEAGHRLCVQTRTASKAGALVERGAELKATAAEVAAACEVVMLCVPDTPDVEGVLFGAGGVVEGARAGLIVVDHSTISPEATRGFAQRLAERGVRLIDAPVSGGDVGAQRGTLSIMAGGDAEAFARVEPLLGCYGTAVRVGESGAGQACKACNQLAGSAALIGVCEAVALARSQGIDVGKMIEVVCGGASASWMMENLGPRAAAGDDAPGFFVDYLVKDLRIVAEAAGGGGLELEGLAAVKRLFERAAAMGHGRDGTQAVRHAVEGGEVSQR